MVVMTARIMFRVRFYAECIADAGAIILPWVVFFIEGIMTNANICLYDPSNMNQESKKVLAEACALFEVDLQSFLTKLEERLSDVDGKRGFLPFDNSPLRHYFLKPVESCSDEYFDILGVKQ